jgi:3-deoxy-D-manno-octulosonate cytidylyltransferase
MSKPTIIAMIPARYAASRFPAKLMQDLCGKTVITRVYENTVATGLFDAVMVVSDSEIIAEEIRSQGGTVIMSQKEHESGSDRIAEAVADLDVDIIINVQGDTPFVERDQLAKLVEAFAGIEGAAVQVASLMIPLDPAFLHNENFVKVVVDKNNRSLLFSRSVIPYPRNKEITIPYYKHVGVYAFRKQALMNFTAWPMTPLEAAEKIECLRYLENGVSLKMVQIDHMGAEIDTPEDLERARNYFQAQQNLV